MFPLSNLRKLVSCRDMKLVWDSRSRQFDCEVQLHIGFMDFFAVKFRTRMVRYYATNTIQETGVPSGTVWWFDHSLLGRIQGIYLPGRGVCAGGELSSEDLLRGALDIRVNGEMAMVSPFWKLPSSEASRRRKSLISCSFWWSVWVEVVRSKAASDQFHYPSTSVCDRRIGKVRRVLFT